MLNRHVNLRLNNNKDQVIKNLNKLNKSNMAMVKAEEVTLEVVTEEVMAVVAEVAIREITIKKKVDIEVVSSIKRAIIRKKVVIEEATENSNTKKKVKVRSKVKKVNQAIEEAEAHTEVVEVAEDIIEAEVAMEAMKAMKGNKEFIDLRIKHLRQNQNLLKVKARTLVTTLDIEVKHITMQESQEKNTIHMTERVELAEVMK